MTSNTNNFAIAGYNKKEPLTKQQQEKIENIKKNLTVDVKETNAYKRKKISAHDDRPSAKAVGSILGIGVLSVVFCLIVIPDIPTLIRDFWHGTVWRQIIENRWKICLKGNLEYFNFPQEWLSTRSILNNHARQSKVQWYKKVAHCTQVHVMVPVGPLVVTLFWISNKICASLIDVYRCNTTYPFIFHWLLT